MNWKIPHILVCFSLLACIVPGCLDEDGFERIVLVDDMGQEIRLNATPRRLIALTPALTEIVFLLGCGDRLVGIDSDSNYPAEAASIEKVSSWQGLNTERIVVIDPDLIFMDRTLDASGDRYDTLKGLGLPVYRIYPQDMDGLISTIDDISLILDVHQKGREVSDALSDRIEAVSSSAKDDPAPAPKVLHVVYFDGSSDPWVMTSSTFSGDMVGIAGGENAVSDGTGISVQVSIEMIIASDPDIIICSQSPLWPTRSRELLMSDEAMKDVSAVKGGFVRDIDADIIDRTGPRLVSGLEEMRSIISEYHTGG